MSADVLPIRRPKRGPERDGLGEDGSDSRPSDEAVARACGRGDDAAIGELFERFHRPVARYISRLSDSPDDVEDLVQKVFFEVVRKKAIYDGRASVTTWLFSIATNIVRQDRRARRRRRFWTLAFGKQEGERVEAPVDDRVQAKLQLIRAQRALTELRPKLREAFVLCELEGMSAREAAEILGVSETAIWKRVSNARRSIRDKTLGMGR